MCLICPEKVNMKQKTIYKVVDRVKDGWTPAMRWGKLYLKSEIGKTVTAEEKAANKCWDNRFYPVSIHGYGSLALAKTHLHSWGLDNPVIIKGVLYGEIYKEEPNLLVDKDVYAGTKFKLIGEIDEE